MPGALIVAFVDRIITFWGVRTVLLPDFTATNMASARCDKLIQSLTGSIDVIGLEVFSDFTYSYYVSIGESSSSR